MKIIFAGTSEFGIPTLEKIKAHYELVLIITQPDKPVGRKQVLTPPPIKVWAEKNNIRVEQPEKIINLKAEMQRLNPDLLLVAAYGQILPKEILDLPKFGSVNIHGSLLPKYRGASPIQAAILNGDGETGITLIRMDEKLDHGPILAKEVIRLTGTETLPKLYEVLAGVSADMIEKFLPLFFAGRVQTAEQIHTQATFTKPLSRADSKIDWTEPAKVISQKIRAFNPEPGTWTTLEGKIVKILSAEIINESKIELPGKIYTQLGDLVVKCIDASLLIREVQPEGKKPMSGKDFLNGLQSKARLFI